MKKNEEYIVDIIDNGYEGEGIAKIDNFTIFILGRLFYRKGHEKRPFFCRKNPVFFLKNTAHSLKINAKSGMIKCKAKFKQINDFRPLDGDVFNNERGKKHDV